MVDVGGVSIYAYNWKWLAFPYGVRCAPIIGDDELVLTCLQIGLVITGLTIALGTHSLYNYNTSDLSFSFSHIVATTRNGVFNTVLSGARRDQLHHQVMEEAGVALCFGKDGFASYANN